VTTPLAPLTQEEERLLRFARSINGGLADMGPVTVIDRLLATLTAERAASSEWRQTAYKMANRTAAPGGRPDRLRDRFRFRLATMDRRGDRRSAHDWALAAFDAAAADTAEVS
jgi:hypothetical protein